MITTTLIGARLIDASVQGARVIRNVNEGVPITFDRPDITFDRPDITFDQEQE
jgi:hypothetical protein